MKCKFCGTNSGLNIICSTCLEKWKIIKSSKIWKSEHQKLLDEISGNTKERAAK